MTDAPALLTEDQDSILIATLNRPDKLNALNLETMDLLTEAVLRFRDDENLKVMLIRAKRWMLRCWMRPTAVHRQRAQPKCDA